MNNITILVADDENRIRRLVLDFLKREGYQIIEAQDGEEAINKFYDNMSNVDLIILDVLMPKFDGFEVLDSIRKESDVPVIMLTAKAGEYDQLNGFRHGADDYVTKPFSPSILVARVQALLKRTGKIKTEMKAYGLISIDEAAHSVFINNEKIELTPKEYDLLLYLTANNGRALTREQILHAVWNYDYYGDLRTVDTHIKQIRAKLNDYGDYIQTIRGIGYKFEVK